MPTKKLEDFPDWLEWLNTNFQRQCEVPELTNILLQNGFSRQSIEAAIFAAQSSTKSLHEPQFNKVDYLKLAQPHFTQTNYSCRVHQIVNTKLQIYLIYDFLSSNVVFGLNVNLPNSQELSGFILPVNKLKVPDVFSIPFFESPSLNS